MADQRIPRDILEDRWAGLFEEDGTGTAERTGEAERRFLDLIDDLREVVDRIARRDTDQHPTLGGVPQELYDMVREHVIRRVHEASGGPALRAA